MEFKTSYNEMKELDVSNLGSVERQDVSAVSTPSKQIEYSDVEETVTKQQNQDGSFHLDDENHNNTNDIRLPEKLYASFVREPSYYTAMKHKEYGTLKYVLRKISGIPFAVLYGYLLAWIISNIILSNHDDRLYLNFTYGGDDFSANICNSSFSVVELINDTNKENEMENINEKAKRNYGMSPFWNNDSIALFHHTLEKGFLNSSDGKTEEKPENPFERNSPELYFATYAFMAVIGLTSLFSRNTRGTMLLVLPGLVTKHSRNFIFTIVLGLLVNGPVHTLKMNINNLFQNTVCLYKNVITVACVKQKDFDMILEHARTLYDTLGKMRELFNKIYCFQATCPKTVHPPFKYSNMSWQTLESMTATSTTILKSQVSMITDKVNSVTYYLDMVRILLTAISIILIIVDAIRYLRSYYIDNDFDNMYLGRATLRFWRKRNYKSLTPLRHWERNAGYQVSSLPKFTGMRKVIRKTLATFVVFMMVVIIILVDYLLAETLEYMKRKEEFNIPLSSGPGNQNGGYQTNTCLTKAEHTEVKFYWTMMLLLFVAVLSCVFEVYMSRVRAKLCNLFYPDKAEERADCLYYKIFNGRVSRRKYLVLTVRRELEKRMKLVRFSPWKRFTKLVSRLCLVQKRNIICPGCSWKVRGSKTQWLSFEHSKKVIRTKICLDCYLDLSWECQMDQNNGNNDIYLTLPNAGIVSS